MYHQRRRKKNNKMHKAKRKGEVSGYHCDYIIETLETKGKAGLRKLIRDGYDLDAPKLGEMFGNPIDDTPLQRAARIGSSHVLEMLLNYGKFNLNYKFPEEYLNQPYMGHFKM